MRVPLVAANWKMHGDSRFVSDYFTQLQNQLAAQSVQPSGKTLDIAVFPPFVYLQQALTATGAAGISAVHIGAQNLSREPEGAFTGEVSAQMLTDIGCRMVLVGHSERRSLYGESDALVADKFVAAQHQGLIPVLCVGETLAQRESGDTLTVVGQQLDAVIATAGLDNVAAAVIAYEPVWAIGTGKTATPEQAQDVHRAIRDLLGSAGQQTRILYGGSVKAANAEDLFSQPDIDGGLVGGASLDAEEFSVICAKAMSN